MILHSSKKEYCLAVSGLCASWYGYELSSGASFVVNSRARFRDFMNIEASYRDKKGWKPMPMENSSIRDK